MNLLEIAYKYDNRFINSDELISKIDALNTEFFNEEEKDIFNKLIDSIKYIKLTTPNEMDEYLKNRLKQIDSFIKVIENTKNLNEDDQKHIDKYYKTLLNDKLVVLDGGKLYLSINELLKKNVLIKDMYDKLSDEELLDFITNYISAPKPPIINQKKFNELANIGIKNDKREALWRLAFNYDNKKMDCSLIEDYFIEKRDDYYLLELACALEGNLNLKKLSEKVLITKDKIFIDKVISGGLKFGIINESDLKGIKY